MRVTRTKSGIRVRATAGTHVVTLGMNASKQDRKGLLGFAIRRTDLTEGERYWLRGMKTFREVVPIQLPGANYSLLEHPVQTFRWADSSAKPGHDYVYEVVPMRGKPRFPEPGHAVEVTVSTESEGDSNAVHEVYFNRGVAGSQDYARKFGNRKPTEMTAGEAEKAYGWLSRGLEEALLRFIARAQSNRYALRAAVYEFNHDPVLEAFKQAMQRGADVEIVYDARRDHPQDSTKKALKRTGTCSMAIPRKAGKAISHNKFIVLLHNDRPIAVWTGSTNITRSGLYGQSNVGHIVWHPAVARAYYDYWRRLREDPSYSQLRNWILNHTPDPSGPPPQGTTALFSPRKGIGVLEWYAKRLSKARRSAQMTAAFGVHDLCEDVLGHLLAHLNGVHVRRVTSELDTEPHRLPPVAYKICSAFLYHGGKIFAHLPADSA